MVLKIMLLAENARQSEPLVTELIGLAPMGYQVTRFVLKDGSLSDISRCEPDLVIFHVRFLTKSVLETIKIINFANPKPIIVFADEDGLVSANEVINAGVSSYVVDGLKPGRVKSIVDVTLVRFADHQALSKELFDIKGKLDDRKWIDKAKGVLMQMKGMDEAQAYKMMRSTAMKNNKRLVDIAKNILSVSQLVGKR